MDYLIVEKLCHDHPLGLDGADLLSATFLQLQTPEEKQDFFSQLCKAVVAFMKGNIQIANAFLFCNNAAFIYQAISESSQNVFWSASNTKGSLG